MLFARLLDCSFCILSVAAALDTKTPRRVDARSRPRRLVGVPHRASERYKTTARIFAALVPDAAIGQLIGFQFVDATFERGDSGFERGECRIGRLLDAKSDFALGRGRTGRPNCARRLWPICQACSNAAAARFTNCWACLIPRHPRSAPCMARGASGRCTGSTWPGGRADGNQPPDIG